jgi:hypothetical protein
LNRPFPVVKTLEEAIAIWTRGGGVGIDLTNVPPEEAKRIQENFEKYVKGGIRQA